MKFQLLIKPSRPVFDTKDSKKALRLVEQLNGVKDLYRSVYNYYGDPDTDNALIDKIYIDIDPEEGKDLHEEAKKVHLYCKRRGLRHAIFFSGRGFNIYVFTHSIMACDLNDPRGAIRNFVTEMSEEIGITPDWQVIGDLRRVSRIPNTVNKKTHLFCIPLSPINLLERDLIEIQEMAKNQIPETPDLIVGENLIDLREYDEKVKKLDLKKVLSLNIDDLSLDTDIHPDLPLCVKESLKHGNPGYQARYNIITALRDYAYTKDEVIQILSKYLTEDKFVHCVDEEGQVDYLFDRQELLFPACGTIKAQGLCVCGCKGQKIYRL